MAPQLGLTCPKKVVYFGMKTPIIFTSQCLLEIGGFDYEGVSVNFADWGELKPKTPTGVLPYAEMPDGKIISESGAIGRTIAGAAGLLGEGNDFMTSEMLVGMTADLNKKIMEICPTAMTVANFDDSKKKAFEAGKPGVLEFATKFEKFLLPSGDRFTESGLTYGEVELFCKLNCSVTGAIPELASGGLAAFYKRMEAVPGIRKVLDGQSKFGAIGNYLVAIP